MPRIIQGHLTRVSLAVSFSALFFAIIWIAGRATPLAQFLAGASIITVFAHAIAALGWFEALSFLTICLAVTFTVENFGVLTGFPFGHYTFLVEPNIPHIGVIPQSSACSTLAWATPHGSSQTCCWARVFSVPRPDYSFSPYR